MGRALGRRRERNLDRNRGVPGRRQPNLSSTKRSGRRMEVRFLWSGERFNRDVLSHVFLAALGIGIGGQAPQPGTKNRDLRIASGGC